MAMATEIEDSNTVILDLPVSLSMALRPFWSGFWRGWVVNVAAAMLNFLVLVMLRNLGYGPHTPTMAQWLTTMSATHEQWIIKLADLIQPLVFQIAILNIVFQKSWRYFSLVPRDTVTGAPIVLSYRQTIKLWWSLCWRQFLLVFAVVLAFGLVAGLGAVVFGKGTLVFHGTAILLILAAFVAVTYIFLKTNAIVMQKRYSDFAMTVVLRNPA